MTTIKMHKLQMLLCALFLVVPSTWVNGETKALADVDQDGSKGTSLSKVLLGKSRQSRCVRCYEDRYYGSSASTGGGGGAGGGGGYGSRSSGDDRYSWYYPMSYDRYEDRSNRDRDYYSNYRDDRYTPRTYDRYESRGYDDYRRGGGYGSSDRSYGSSDRGYGASDRGYGYGYDNNQRDRYSNDRYGDYYRDRSYDRYRGGSYDRYERDPYDRYYSRYDFRNYRPWDETYRGQSGFDNSGRGYYFATETDDRPSPNYNRERERSPSPCGYLISNCPYGSSDDRGTKVSSNAIDSGNQHGGHTSVIGKHSDGNSKNGQNSWTYMNDQDKEDGRGGSGGSSNSGGSGGGSGGGNGGNGGSRNREQDPQSSSFGGRPPRPLSGSYLFDRESNVIDNAAGQNEIANASEGNANGAEGMTDSSKSGSA